MTLAELTTLERFEADERAFSSEILVELRRRHGTRAESILREIESDIAADRAMAPDVPGEMVRHAAVPQIAPDRADILRRNAVRQFLNDRFAADPAGRIKAGNLFGDYQAASDRSKLPRLDVRTFHRAMTELGIEKRTFKDGNKWIGLRERRQDDIELYAADAFEVEPLAVVAGSSARRDIKRIRGFIRMYQRRAKRLRREQASHYLYLSTDCDYHVPEAEQPAGRVLALVDRMTDILAHSEGTTAVNEQEYAELKLLFDRADAILDPPLSPLPEEIDVSDLPPVNIRPIDPLDEALDSIGALIRQHFRHCRIDALDVGNDMGALV